MQTTDDEIDSGDEPQYQIRSVRFKPDEWQAVLKHTGMYGVKVGSFLRACALRAVGYRTEADKLVHTAQAISAAVASLGGSSAGSAAAPAAPAKKKTKSSKKR